MNDYLHFPSDDELHRAGDDGRSDEGLPLYPSGAFGDDADSADTHRVADGGERQLVTQIIGPASPVYNAVQDAAQRFGLHLPCLPEEVEIAHRHRLWWLHEQAQHDTCVQESLDALRRQAKDDRELLMRWGNDPALQPPASAGIQPLLVPLGAVGFIVGCLLIALVVHVANSGSPNRGTGTAPLLRVRCSPWAVCYLDGKRVGNVPSPRPIQATPGRHTIRLEPKTGAAFTYSVDLAPRTNTLLTVDLRARRAEIQVQER